jgi:hypothetical protein
MLEHKKLLPSAYLDPFKVDKIQSIHIFLNRSIFTDKVEVISTIEFRNGNTTGKQNFDTETIEEGIKQMQQFLNQLNNG